MIERPLSFFLKALREHKKRPENFNDRALKWKWLHEKVSEISFKRRQMYSRVSPRFRSFEDVLKQLQKKTGVPLVRSVCLSTGRARLFPKDSCRGFYKDYETAYLSHIEFTWAVSKNIIRWSDDDNHYHHSSDFYWVYSLNDQGRPVQKETASKNSVCCKLCNKEWMSKYISKHPILRTASCPVCRDRKLVNPVLTRESVYGEYHSHRSAIKFFPHRLKKEESLPVGVELEMQSKSPNGVFNPAEDAIELYEFHRTINPEWNLFYCERDGSLATNSMELITQPMTLELHKVFWAEMLPKIREKFKGWNVPAQFFYGIHLTFETSLFGTLPTARLLRFFDTQANGRIAQTLAQRGILYGANDYLCNKDKKLKEIVLFEKGKILGSNVRNSAVNIKMNGDLAEVRLFASTLNQTSFMKNLDFIYLFKAWCESTPWNLDGEQFLLWVAKNADKYYEKHPHFYEYFLLETFPCKHAVHSTKNIWRNLFMDIASSYKKGQKDFFSDEFYTVPQEDYQCA